MEHRSRLTARIGAVSAIIGALCTIGLSVTVAGDAIVRNFQGGSVPGLVEISETLLIAMVFLGLPYCNQIGAHIRMNLVTMHLPARIAAAARSLADLGTLTVLVWATKATGGRALESITSREYQQGLVQWPLWPARVLITMGFALMIPSVITALYGHLRNVVGKPIASNGADDDTSAILAV